MHICECVCLCGDCVVFVCGSGNVCMVIVCLHACMHVCECMRLYGECVVFVWFSGDVYMVVVCWRGRMHVFILCACMVIVLCLHVSLATVV